MKLLNRLTLSIIAAALLAACGGSQPPIGAPGAMPQSRAVAAHTERNGSWMLPEAKSDKALLYASDAETDSVFVYDYKTGQEVGELYGFTSPYGDCVDKRGDVFLSSEVGSGGEVTEYTHGGANPLKVF